MSSTETMNAIRRWAIKNKIDPTTLYIPEKRGLPEVPGFKWVPCKIPKATNQAGFAVYRKVPDIPPATKPAAPKRTVKPKEPTNE